MKQGARIATTTLLVVAGVALCAFFGFLLGMADCGPDCRARGERAPVYAFIGLGVSLIALGLSLPRGALRATGHAMLAGGAVVAGGALWVATMEAGRGAIVWVTLAIGIGCVVVGAWLAFWKPR